MKFSVEDNVNLSMSNTLRLPVRAEYYCEAYSTEHVAEALTFVERQGLPLLVLGDASNVVLPPVLKGLTLRVRMEGIEQHGDVIKVGAGVNWNNLVMLLCEDEWSGLENLSGIPGSVGAAPIQNIGAYGVQIEDCIVSVSVYDRHDGCACVMSREDCRFGYRDSIFKGEYRDRMVVTNVSLHLSKQFPPVTSYRDLQAANVQTPLEMARLVRSIRSRKLPDPVNAPNVGSFFKNPILDESAYVDFRSAHPTAPDGVRTDEGVKIHAAWLIERCGLKSMRVGDAMVSEQHALVIVNTGAATQSDVDELATRVREAVSDRFNLSLTIEPTVLPL